MEWQKTKNIGGLEVGNYRSIVGYAGESLVVRRALVCGFSVSLKAWRDSKCDAVASRSTAMWLRVASR